MKYKPYEKTHWCTRVHCLGMQTIWPEPGCTKVALLGFEPHGPQIWTVVHQGSPLSHMYLSVRIRETPLDYCSKELISSLDVPTYTEQASLADVGLLIHAIWFSKNRESLVKLLLFREIYHMNLKNPKSLGAPGSPFGHTNNMNLIKLNKIGAFRVFEPYALTL